MREIKLYIATNTINGKRYVGLTARSIADRWIQHRRDAHAGSQQPLQIAIAKFGEKSFVLKHVASATTPFAAYELEAELIQQWNTLRPSGYNDLAKSNVIPIKAGNCMCERCGRPFHQKLSRLAIKGRGRFCSHYCRWNIPLAEKFWPKVEKTDECWLWTGCRTGTSFSDGYGRLFVGKGRHRKTVLAHRLSYELAFGKIPDGLHLDHLCRNTLCVNPSHLEPVTCAENNARGISPAAKNKRKTQCKHGHPLSGKNLRARQGCNGRPGRECVICRKEISRRYAERRKQMRALERPQL